MPNEKITSQYWPSSKQTGHVPVPPQSRLLMSKFYRFENPLGVDGNAVQPLRACSLVLLGLPLLLHRQLHQLQLSWLARSSRRCERPLRPSCVQSEDDLQL